MPSSRRPRAVSGLRRKPKELYKLLSVPEDFQDPPVLQEGELQRLTRVTTSAEDPSDGKRKREDCEVVDFARVIDADTVALDEDLAVDILEPTHGTAAAVVIDSPPMAVGSRLTRA